MTTPDVNTYTWSSYVAAIQSLLPKDAQRLGPVQPYIAQLIRNGVIELQTFIPAYQMNHETLFHPTDFAPEGYAARAAFPPQAKIRDAYIVSYNQDSSGKYLTSCKRFPLTKVSWNMRMALVDGKVAINGNHPCIAIDPQTETFYIYPALKDGQDVSIFWDGKKINFQAQEITPFDEESVLVIADYLKARLSREVDGDLPLEQSYQQSYMTGRSLLYLNTKDRGTR